MVGDHQAFRNAVKHGLEQECLRFQGNRDAPVLRPGGPVASPLLSFGDVGVGAEPAGDGAFGIFHGHNLGEEDAKCPSLHAAGTPSQRGSGVNRALQRSSTWVGSWDRARSATTNPWTVRGWFRLVVPALVEPEDGSIGLAIQAS